MIYLAQPYSHYSVPSYEKACSVLASSLHIQNCPAIYSPIVHWHEVAARYDMTTDHTLYIAHNAELIRRSDMIFLLALPGWGASAGVKWEIDLAAQIEKPVHNFACDFSTSGIEIAKAVAGAYHAYF